MAVSLRIIRLTMAIDEGDHRAYEQLKALAKTDEEARRVLRTVKEPPKPVTKPPVKVAPPPKPDTPKQTEEKARAGNEAAIAALRKKADYEDAAAQSALGRILMSTDPEEARKWLIKSHKVPESMEALRKMANSGDAEAMRFIVSLSKPKTTARSSLRTDPDAPKRDDLGYFKPPTKHTNAKIGDVYRLNGAKMHTDEKNAMVLIKEKKGDYLTVWTVTREPGKRRASLLMDPSVAGFASAKVYVLTDTDRVMHKSMLAEYRGTLSTRDAKQFRLSV